MSDLSNYTPEEAVERYCLGEMDANEKQAFEKRLEEDAQLSTLLEELKPAILALKMSDLSNNLREIHLEQSSPSGGSKRFIYIGIAASISIIALFFSITFQQSNEDLFDTYFQPYPDVITKRSNANESSSESGMASYSSGDYEKTIESLSSNSQLSPDQLFYLAQAHLALKEGEKAIEILESNSFEDSKLKSQVNWYLALGYLLTENETKGKELLRTLAQGEGSYKERAEELLNRLE